MANGFQIELSLILEQMVHQPGPVPFHPGDQRHFVFAHVQLAKRRDVLTGAFVADQLVESDQVDLQVTAEQFRRYHRVMCVCVCVRARARGERSRIESGNGRGEKNY